MSLKCLRGRTGSRGPRGADGDGQGAKGSPGPRGNTGPRGSPGRGCRDHLYGLILHRLLIFFLEITKNVQQLLFQELFHQPIIIIHGIGLFTI